ncbi:MAG: ABC transporter ATP-binding protein [Chloroflexota bacterium]
MKDQPVIEFENISKRFVYSAASPRTMLEMLVNSVSRKDQFRQEQDLWAVKNLDMEIRQGQCLGLIGRNGSGKSTVLKLITRILRPTTGRMVVRGRVSALLELGAGFHPDLTGRENVYLNASVLGLSRTDVDQSFDSIIAFSELGNFIDMPVKHYSSGMYMRLGFSIAIHVRPDVLIVDEVLAVGDQAFQNKCIEHIYKMKRQGVTIVIVSHHASTIRSLCTHALWLDKGSMKAYGLVQEVLPQYEFHQEQRRADQVHAVKEQAEAADKAGIEIHALRFLTTEGQEQSTFTTGDEMVVEMAYTPHETVPDPTFELMLVRADGIQVHTVQQQFTGVTLRPENGLGQIRCKLGALPLLPAAYQLKTAVYGPTTQANAYDTYERPFQITAPTRPQTGGLIDIPIEWDWLSPIS